MSARKEALSEMKKYLMPCKFWDEWLNTTGELPPDFEKLPSVPNLPDPMDFMSNKVVRASDWDEQRTIISEHFQYYVFGSYPPPPDEVIAEEISRQKEGNGAVRKEIELSFGPGKKAKLRCEMLVPGSDNNDKFPVFMTQRNHYAWSRIALSRGYVAVSYNGCDSADDSQEFKKIWPGYDWTKLVRRAWAAGRVLDYLHTLPYVDKRHACITGHSRNGKLALIAGAIDERFDAVISSSSGLGGATPYRFNNDAHFGAGIEIHTSLPHNMEWFHPRLRFFAGREHKLPVDSNLLIGLSAPRAVLISCAENDSCDNLRAAEVAVRSAAGIWNLLDAEKKLRLMVRSGEHETRPTEIETYLDWCDLNFDRVGQEREERLHNFFRNQWVFNYDFETWKKMSGVKIDVDDMPGKDRSIPARVECLLGEDPPHARGINGAYGCEKPYKSLLLNRPVVIGNAKIERYNFNFGQYIPGALYTPAGLFKIAVGNEINLPHYPSVLKFDEAKKIRNKVPLVIWLSCDSVSCGYSGATVSGSQHMPEPLAKDGFAVLTFDHIGNGNRVGEWSHFYERYPRWSVMGKMVYDTRSAISAALQMGFADPERIFIAGFGIGATAAILTAALDNNVAGVASVCGFTPVRTDTADRPTGGIARYATWDGMGFLPNLGFFADEPSKVPVDFDEILSSIAPRYLLAVTPTLDREANHEEVLETLEKVKAVYRDKGAGDRFRHHAPADYRRYSPAIQDVVHQSLHEMAGM